MWSLWTWWVPACVAMYMHLRKVHATSDKASQLNIGPAADADAANMLNRTGKQDI